jgi:peptidoglycan/xylan/chitin deacetylase (PgdA/CDA1 family)
MGYNNSTKSLRYIDSRQEDKYCLLSCLTWLAGILAGIILFLIFLLAFQPELVSEQIRQIPQKASQVLSQLRGKSGATNSSNPVAILMYHYIRIVDKQQDPLGFSLSVSPTVFESQIEHLVENFNVIDLADFMAGKIPERAVILTFDDGYEDLYTTAAPVLKRYGLPSTVFMITGRIGQNGYLSAEQLKGLERKFSVTIGSHSVNHPNLVNTSLVNQVREIVQSQAALEKIIGKQVEYFCFPSGEYSHETLDALRQADYKIAVTTQDGLAYRKDNWLTLPRVRVSNSMGLEGFREKLSKLFKDSQTSAP